MHDTFGDPSAPSDFDLAAAVCGHDTTTVDGASAARHDYRVWDVLDGWAIAEHIANARAAIANSTTVRP